ncbi:MAG: mechanosensitive ion channel family protein [Candidatus Pacebacteria bacterium]|nr:mechanosensitive ion channel family protein [Candidatus Paceibacterota bacterium]
MQNQIILWIQEHGLQIVLIFAVALVVRKFSSVFIEKTVRRLIVSDKFLDNKEEKQREDTIIKIFENTLGITVWIVIVLMILSELGVEIGPILAAAGIAGVAIGFGGQYFIRDLISGLFIIVENQYRIGDVVCFSKICGLVEDVSLRKTILRDLDGTVHHVPHGEITTVSNLSKEYARVNLNISVSYASDLENVIKVVNKVGKELAEDGDWEEHIKKAPQFLRVDAFEDSGIAIKILGETKPLKQWDVTGELRKRLKIAFDKEGIEIPFPQRVIHTAKQ